MAERTVVDTNVLLSGLLFPQSPPGRVLRTVLRNGQLLVSAETLAELADVLARPKFDAYIDVADRMEFLRRLARVAETVSVVRTVRACRDPRDDKFLEVAVNGDATAIVTGDNDLLALNPFLNIAILTPALFLARPRV